MTEIILHTIISLSGLGAVSAIILFFVAQKFKVDEDFRIDEVETVLPMANCGGCGFAGCRNFAEKCVKANDLTGLFCPVGGNDTMTKVAQILGRNTITQDPRVAVLRCNGSCEFQPKTTYYDGAPTCAIASALYGGETDCQYGCLGFGDCVVVCTFDALHMNPLTGLPVVADEKCTSCGACLKACPKGLFELRKRGKKDKKIYVACRNEDKGNIAKKSCEVACTGCNKCFLVCPYEAIVVNNFLAYINSDKCTLCRKCVPECPTDAILEIGFPPHKDKMEDTTATSETILKSDKTEGIDSDETINNQEV